MRPKLLLRRALLIGALLLGCGCSREERAQHPASYVGSEACADCHQQAHDDWARSHHALAMQPVSPAAALGDFADRTFVHGGTESRFFRRDGGWYCRTDGEDGAMAEFAVRYCFGVEPLQQYLADTGKGRLQALDIAWDARPQQQGGQRWFHLHPDERIAAGDPLHWTGPNLNWNFMCAECHSTGVHKGYREQDGSYATSFAEVSVGCEGCHGPASRHLEWARAGGGTDGDKGLVLRLPGTAGFALQPGKASAVRMGPRDAAEPEACARCHSRRTPIAADYAHGAHILDTHQVALLDEGLYFADGQIQDEVFEYGSFVQSKMYAEGVGCGDCHEPHGGRLRAEGNALCARCHDAQVFDQPAHHRHAAGGVGAQCVECHMPRRTYMQVDPRRDHSIRVPRPDLSVRFGVPNACAGCHADQSPQWAAAAVASWRQPGAAGPMPHWTEAIDAGRRGTPRAEQLLVEAVQRAEWPGIVRGTAASLLAGHARESSTAALRTALRDADPFVRLGAVRGLAALPRPARARALEALLQDPILAVRLAAAEALAEAEGDLSAAGAAALQASLRDYDAAQGVNADRDFAWTNRALIALRRGDLAAAEALCRLALAVDAGSVRAVVNLADVLREQGRDDEGEPALRAALERAHDKGPIAHALGLLLVRQGRADEAMPLLAQAARLSPDDARFAYVLAVALHDRGQQDAAVAELQRASARRPWDPDLLSGLLWFLRERDGPAAALPFAAKLLELRPEDAELRALVAELQSGG